MITSQAKNDMSFTQKGKKVTPIFTMPINDTYIIAAYQGGISKYDILIKYRQHEHSKWSRIRTPKHIHWAVDVLIKAHADRELTESFLDFLMEQWEEVKGFESDKERQLFLNIEHLISINQKAFTAYAALTAKGEYSIKFLILLAQLLMVQEKTNLETAYMFKKLLDALRKGDDIFRIVSIATHR